MIPIIAGIAAVCVLATTWSLVHRWKRGRAQPGREAALHVAVTKSTVPMFHNPAFVGLDESAYVEAADTSSAHDYEEPVPINPDYVPTAAGGVFSSDDHYVLDSDHHSETMT